MSGNEARKATRSREILAGKSAEFFNVMRKEDGERATDDNAIWAITLNELGEA